MSEDNELPVLCYEVWFTSNDGKTQLVGAYWHVLIAWRVAGAINKTSSHEGTAEVSVASGMEIWIPTAERRKRTDVIESSY